MNVASRSIRAFAAIGRGHLALMLLSSLALLAAPRTACADDEQGFKSLFNGKDFGGWDGNPEFWRIEDGTITGETTKDHQPKANTFCIWREGPVDDFVLRCSYKLTGGPTGANSGVQYRSKEFEKWGVGGYQADMEAGDKYSGILYEERMRGILAERGQKVVIGDDGKKEVTVIGDSKDLQANIHRDGWNDYEVTAQGNHLIHKINGKVTVEIIDNQAAKRAMSGILALQLHKGFNMKVQFKDLRLKRLPLSDGRKKIVLVAGHPSHGPGEHEFNAGTLILKSCLDKLPNIIAVEYLNHPGQPKDFRGCDKSGWPNDPTAFDNADSILIYADGAGGHPMIQGNHLEELGRLMDKGVGLCCAHYAVEIPKDKGGPELTRWIGGFYENGFSTNPFWEADYKSLPKHPITSGVQPFKITDEWYFNIRFPEGLSGVEPILKATPPANAAKTDAARANAGREEIMAWATQRADGGRGFGFTGAHRHTNWGDDNFRKLVLNALVWSAKGEVPREGIASSVSPEQLKENLDPKMPHTGTGQPKKNAEPTPK